MVHQRFARHTPWLKSWIAATALALAATLSAPAATAITLDGKWGVGFEETLTGIVDTADPDSPLIAIPASGLAIHRFVGDWDVELVFGARAAFASSTATRWAGFGSLGGHYSAFRSPQANLSAGIRVIAGAYQPLDIATGGKAPMQVGFAMEIPLRAVFFLSDRFVISGAVGIVGALESKTGNPLTGGKDAVKVSLFKGGFSGGLGFMFLFN